MIHKLAYVKLGLTWTDARATLDHEMNGRQLDEIGRCMYEAIGWQLTT